MKASRTPCATSLRLARAPGIVLRLLSGPLLLMGAQAAENGPTTLDAGGGLAKSQRYALHGTLGWLGGLAGAETPAVLARHGYAGQLYETRHLAATAQPAVVAERDTSQLAAVAVMDDTTLLPLPPTAVAWSVAAGPIDAISADGLATTRNVYETTQAIAQVDYQSVSSQVAIEILNTGDDDFGLYAGDGLNDAWQVGYFGLENPLARPGEDPDEDRADNAQEYVADTNPVDPRSLLRITGSTWSGGVRVRFESSARRLYTLYSTRDLESGPWTAVPSQTDVPGTGNEQTLTDPTPAQPRAFYRLGVNLPSP